MWTYDQNHYCVLLFLSDAADTSQDNVEENDSDSENEDEDERNEEEMKKDLIECAANLQESIMKNDFPSLLDSLRMFDRKVLKKAKYVYESLFKNYLFTASYYDVN